MIHLNQQKNKEHYLQTHINYAPLFIDRIPIQPPPRLGVVVSEAIIKEPSFSVCKFGGEPEWIVQRDCFAAGSEGFAEGGVLVAGGDGLGVGVDQGGQVSIAIKAGVVGGSGGVVVLGNHEEAADASGSLHRSAEVGAPGVGAVLSSGWVLLDFGKEFPAVVDVNPGFLQV